MLIHESEELLEDAWIGSNVTFLFETSIHDDYVPRSRQAGSVCAIDSSSANMICLLLPKCLESDRGVTTYMHECPSDGRSNDEVRSFGEL